MNAVVLSGDRPAAARDASPRSSSSRRSRVALVGVRSLQQSCGARRLGRRRLCADRIRRHRRRGGARPRRASTRSLFALYIVLGHALGARAAAAVPSTGSARRCSSRWSSPRRSACAMRRWRSSARCCSSPGIGVGCHVLRHSLCLRPARDGAAAARDLRADAGAAAGDRGDRRRAGAAADPLARSSFSASRWSAIGIAIHKPASA